MDSLKHRQTERELDDLPHNLLAERRSLHHGGYKSAWIKGRGSRLQRTRQSLEIAFREIRKQNEGALRAIRQLNCWDLRHCSFVAPAASAQYHAKVLSRKGSEGGDNGLGSFIRL